MQNNIEQEMKEILSKLTGGEPDEISLDADLVNDLGIDSLKVIEIATEVERRYKIKIKDSQLVKLRKVGETVALLKEMLEDKT